MYLSIIGAPREKKRELRPHDAAMQRTKALGSRHPEEVRAADESAEVIVHASCVQSFAEVDTY